MWLRLALPLLRYGARHPFRFVFLVGAFIASLISLLLSGLCATPETASTTSPATRQVLCGGEPAESADLEGAAPPRAILNRLWFDRLPEQARDDIKLMLFFSGGIGLVEEGSNYRATFDIFDFERRGNRLHIEHLHDGKKTKSTFTVERCDDQPPFDLCLTMDPPVRGIDKLYTFAYDEDLTARIPWATSTYRAAEAQARAAHR